MNYPTSKLKCASSKKQPISAIQREEIKLHEEKTAETAKVAFECPRCHWIMRSEKPNDKHPIPSVVKPSESNVDGDIVIQNCVCRNPRCQTTFAVYWSNPRDFFIRI
jgi:hypothetical protein